MLVRLALIGLGGAIGAILRYLMGYAILAVLSNQNLLYSFISTFCVNMLACFCIGICVALLRDSSSLLYIFFAIGVLGGFSTFSSLSLEVFKLLQSGFIVVATGYILLSNIFGVLFVWIGYSMLKQF